MIKSRFELYVGQETQYLTFVYVKDLARVIIDLLTMGKNQEAYFVTDGEVYTAEKFNQEVKTFLKRSTLKMRLPLSLIKILAIISEKISSLSGRFPALNLDKVNEIKCKSWLCSIDNLIHDTGYQAEYNLSRGMEETLAWYQERKIL